MTLLVFSRFNTVVQNLETVRRERNLYSFIKKLVVRLRRLDSLHGDSVPHAASTGFQIDTMVLYLPRRSLFEKGLEVDR